VSAALSLSPSDNPPEFEPEEELLPDNTGPCGDALGKSTLELVDIVELLLSVGGGVIVAGEPVEPGVDVVVGEVVGVPGAPISVRDGATV